MSKLPEKSGVLNRFNIVLLMVIDEVGWRIDMLDWEDGRSVWSEEGFVVDCMSCRRTRGAKAIGGPSNLGVYDVGADLTVVQLLAGSIGRQVDCMEPDQVACL